jgi:hypothetical protein
MIILFKTDKLQTREKRTVKTAVLQERNTRYPILFLGPSLNLELTTDEALAHIKRKRTRDIISKVDEYMFDKWGLS